MATKTKKEMFAEILTIVANNEELTEFVNHEIELLERKNSSKKPTARQLENENFKTAILNFLIEQDTTFSISEMQEQIPELFELKNQRISAILKQLVDDGKVNKTYIKRTPYFGIAH